MFDLDFTTFVFKVGHHVSLGDHGCLNSCCDLAERHVRLHEEPGIAYSVTVVMTAGMTGADRDNDQFQRPWHHKCQRACHRRCQTL